MDRNSVLQDVLSLKNPNIFLQMGTGTGKTRLSLMLMKKWNPKNKVLIVVPKTIDKETWIGEIYKWECASYLPQIEITTYRSFPKYSKTILDVIIFDEVHHLSERCIDAMRTIKSEHNILLSATIKRSLIPFLPRLFNNLYIYKLSTNIAIEEEILPEPKIVLIPLTLSNRINNCEIIKNPKNKPIKTITYAQWKIIHWQYNKTKNPQGVRIICNEEQYYTENEGLINWYKQKSYKNNTMKNAYLKKCGERLTWLSECKVPYTRVILQKLANQRTLVFCNNINQAEKLGKHCIHSKNKQVTTVFNDFNEGKINHITAVAMLDEGVNLTDCPIGIFNNLNSSERIQIQRIGRLLRHKKPVIIIPFFRNTREEEIVKEMLSEYNKDLISVVDYDKLRL